MAATIIISALLILIVFFVIRKLYRDRKNGKTCGCGCSDCAKKDQCHH